MKLASRDYFRLVRNNAIPPGVDAFQSAPIPDGESWTIQRSIFADKNIGDNISGGFLLEFGDGTLMETVTQAFLTGNTIIIPVDRQYTGDGIKFFRMTRLNGSASNKIMGLIIEGFKRL